MSKLCYPLALFRETACRRHETALAVCRPAEPRLARSPMIRVERKWVAPKYSRRIERPMYPASGNARRRRVHRQREKKMASTELDLARVETRGADYIERARALAPLLEDAADEIEAQRQLPERVVDALVEGGFFKLLLPRSLGGAELHPRLCPGARGNRQGRAFDGVVPGAEFRLFDVGTLSRPGGGARRSSARRAAF